MPLEGLPDNVQEVGSITISVFMGPEGLGHAYGLEGMTPEAAIGYLTVTLDRLRNERAYDWDGEGDIDLGDIECPHCHEPLIPVDDEDEDDE